MKIGIVCQWYEPETGSGTVTTSIAHSFRRLGHSVRVLTGVPHYPTGELHPDYADCVPRQEILRGIDVRRTWEYPSHDNSMIKRGWTFASFALSSAAKAPAILGSADALLLYSTPATIGLAGIVARLRHRLPMVLYIQDLWPETLTASGMLPARLSPLVVPPISVFCRAVYNACDLICVTSPGMAEALKKSGVPANKIRFVPNWTTEQYIYELPQPANTDGLFHAMYAGNIGVPQNATMLADVALHLRDDPSIVIDIVGDGTERERLESRVEDLGLNNVVFHGPKPIEEMAQTVSWSHCQLVMLRDDPLFEITLPSKIQASLAFGRPIAASVSGDAAKILRESGAALVTNPNDAIGLANSIRHLAHLADFDLRAMGKRGREFYDSHLSEKNGASALIDALKYAFECQEKRA